MVALRKEARSVTGMKAVTESRTSTISGVVLHKPAEMMHEDEVILPVIA